MKKSTKKQKTPNEVLLDELLVKKTIEKTSKYDHQIESLKNKIDQSNGRA